MKRLVRLRPGGRTGLVLAGLAMLAASLLAAPRARASDTVYYYSSDSLHSEVVITDQNRNVVERTHYAPYGQVLDRSLRDGPAYTGHAEDPGTGLVYMQQRYYDPVAGRFLSADPVQASAGAGFNRYAYANDNPYRYTDLNGMWPSCSTGTHLSGQSCESLGVSVTQVGTPSVTAVRAWNQARKAYIQYADGATEVRSGGRPWRDNNPGDLRKGSSKSASSTLALGWDYSPTGKHDKVTAKLPFAIFSSAAMGDRALKETLQSVYGNSTIARTVNHFAPSSDFNDPQRYAAFIRSYTGVSSTATINSLTPSQLNRTIDAIKAEEGFNNGGSAVIYNFGPGPFSQ